MAVARFLIDKSALARGHLGGVAPVIDHFLKAGLLAACGMTELEVLYSARTAADHKKMRSEFRAAYEWLWTDDKDFHRAIEIHAKLTRLGKHRAVTPPDLVIAAVAERHRVTLLHYDSDFDMIAEITGQPTQWVVPRGSV